MPDQERAENWSEQSDDDLIRTTLSGETRAFDELIRRHSRKLHAMLLQMLGSEADAYDVAQEAFLRAFRSLRHFNKKSAFYTWLYTIAANQARNFIRKRKREHSFSLDDTEIRWRKIPSLQTRRCPLTPYVAPISPISRSVSVRLLTSYPLPTARS